MLFTMSRIITMQNIQNINRVRNSTKEYVDEMMIKSNGKFCWLFFFYCLLFRLYSSHSEYQVK